MELRPYQEQAADFLFEHDRAMVLSPLQQVFQSEMARLRQKYVCLWSRDMVDEWVAKL